MPTQPITNRLATPPLDQAHVSANGTPQMKGVSFQTYPAQQQTGHVHANFSDVTEHIFQIVC